jgi:hypothetical protein
VDQAHGGGAVLLDQVDLDRRAPGRRAQLPVLPAISEDDAPGRDDLHEATDDGGPIGVGPAQDPAGRWVGGGGGADPSDQPLGRGEVRPDHLDRGGDPHLMGGEPHRPPSASAASLSGASAGSQ